MEIGRNNYHLNDDSYLDDFYDREFNNYNNNKYHRYNFLDYPKTNIDITQIFQKRSYDYINHENENEFRINKIK